MDILLITLIVIIIIFLVIYFRHSNNDKVSSIPYATYGSYPIVGHMFSFIRNRTKFLLDCQQRYGQCFRIRLINQSFIFLLSPSDWTTVNRNRSFYLPSAEHGKNIFDISKELYNYPEFDEAGHRQYIQYLKNRDGVRPMVVEFVRRIRNLMRCEKLTLQNSGKISQWIPSGLLEFSHRMMFEPSTLALFGEIDPLSLENDFRVFDNNFHYFAAGLPRWIYPCFFSRELKARSSLNDSWLKNQHPVRESEFMQARRSLFLANLDWFLEKYLGSCQTSIFWASLGNTIPGTFWCLYYILRDPKAAEAIKQEVDTYLPSFSIDNDADDTLIEEWTPEQLNSCVYLESAVNEMLRLAGAPLVTRKCDRETEITLHDGRILNVKPNETIAWFTPTAHLDENLFPEPNKFIFDRFVDKNVDSLPGYMPFGGGKSICPGRFFAKNEMKIALALVLRYVEWRLVDTESMPSQKPERVGFGIAPPNKDIQIMYRYKI